MTRIAKNIKKARLYAGVHFKQGRMFVPVGCSLPTTAKESLGRQLFEAGLIKREEFERMLGAVYDVDTSAEGFEEDYDDEAFQTRTEWEQSSLASYEDFEDIDPEPAVRDVVQPSKPDVPVSDDSNPVSDNPESKGDKE